MTVRSTSSTPSAVTRSPAPLSRPAAPASTPTLKPTPLAPDARSTFEASRPVSTPAALPSAAESKAAAEADRASVEGWGAPELEAKRKAEFIEAHPGDAVYGATMVAGMTANELNRLCVASGGKCENLAAAIKSAVAEGLISARELEQTFARAKRAGTGLDVALAQSGALDVAASVKSVTTATARLEEAKKAAAALEAELATQLTSAGSVVTADQQAAAVDAFRSDPANKKVFDEAASAARDLAATLKTAEGLAGQGVLAEGYTALAQTALAEQALDWASARARSNGPDEKLESIVAAALPTVVAAEAGSGTSAASVTERLQGKLAPFIDPAASAVKTAWDYKGKAETLGNALEAFEKLASGTAKPEDLTAIASGWAAKGALAKALSVGGLAFDLYKVGTADGARERIDALLSTTKDAATIIGGLAKAGRLGSEVLGVGADTIARGAGRLVPGLGVLTSVASAWDRIDANDRTAVGNVGMAVGVAGDLISAFGSGIAATGVGALPGEVIATLGAGVSLVGDGITAVATDRSAQDAREKFWRAANGRLPPDERLSEAVLGYLRGGIFNLNTWRDGGLGRLKDLKGVLSPEALQRAIDGGNLDAVRRLEDQAFEEIVSKGPQGFAERLDWLEANQKDIEAAAATRWRELLGAAGLL